MIKEGRPEAFRPRAPGRSTKRTRRREAVGLAFVRVIEHCEDWSSGLEPPMRELCSPSGEL